MIFADSRPVEGDGALRSEQSERRPAVAADLAGMIEGVACVQDPATLAGVDGDGSVSATVPGEREHDDAVADFGQLGGARESAPLITGCGFVAH
ncbi:hypothetical protein MP11Mi_03380 [Gordonia sp. MP11Mi]|uniref:Uncharacterized protein n=1 Tax=Gordonia sp. MP11Mi TaxID=3022769 RepID=A0AA97CRT0_9ACTN